MKKKEDVDKDKTPVPEEKMSTISRLESKYSDILGRRRRKEHQETEDRDKTLEPDKIPLTPLQRSATTILGASGSVVKKESTPYRLNRNYTDKNQALSTRNYKPRSDLNVLQHSATSALAIPKTNYYDTQALRHKDSVYDIYGTRLLNSNRYNDYDHLNLNTKATYYEGREKENTFKSKYEPSRLYAELNNNETFNRDRNIPKYQKGYRRNATTNLSNYNDDFLNTPSTSTSSGYIDQGMISSSHYCPDRKLGYHRSQTQKFFDSEKSSVLRSLYDDKANENDSIKSEAVKEREARRKEIQGLIAKYAQIDDVFLRATDNDTVFDDKGNSRKSFNNEHNIPPNGSALDGRTTDLSNDSVATSLGLSLGPYSYAQPSNKSSFLPLSKTQSVSSMSSVNRIRIPKTLSTFVR